MILVITRYTQKKPVDVGNDNGTETLTIFSGKIFFLGGVNSHKKKHSETYTIDEHWTQPDQLAPRYNEAEENELIIEIVNNNNNKKNLRRLVFFHPILSLLPHQFAFCDIKFSLNNKNRIFLTRWLSPETNDMYHQPKTISFWISHKKFMQK